MAMTVHTPVAEAHDGQGRASVDRANLELGLANH